MSDSVVSITHRDSAVIIDFLPSAVNPRTYVRLLSGSAPGQRLERYPWIPVAKYLAVADTYPRIAIQVNVSQRGDLVMGEAMVQVPRRLIEELLRYVEAQPEPAVVVDERQGVWTESMVNEFREEIRRRYTQAAQVFKEAAEGSPEVLRFREFARESGLEGQQLRAELGAVSKVSRRLFGRVTWPMTVRDTSEGMTYQMPLEVARWWLA
jgi:hypothetical protein